MENVSASFLLGVIISGEKHLLASLHLEFKGCILLYRFLLWKDPKQAEGEGVITKCHLASSQMTAGKHGLYPLANNHGNPRFCWHRNQV